MDARRAGETIRDDGRGRRDAGEQWRDAPVRRAAASRPMARDRRRATAAARSRPAAAGAAARGTATAGPACDTRVHRAHSRSHARPRAGRAGRASRGDGRRDRAGSRCGAVERVREDGRRRRRAVLTDRRKRRGRAARLTHTRAKTGRNRSRPRRCARPAAGRKRLGQCGSARTLRAQTSSAASHSHAAEYGGGKTKSRQAGHDSAASYAASAQASATGNTSSTQSEPARQSFIVRPRVRAGIAVADVQDSTGAGGARIDPRRPRCRPLTPPPGLVSVAFNRPGIYG